MDKKENSLPYIRKTNKEETWTSYKYIQKSQITTLIHLPKCIIRLLLEALKIANQQNILQGSKQWLDKNRGDSL